MAKEALLKSVEKNLKHVLCGNLDPDAMESVNAAIAMFIIEYASRYSEKELITQFSTMEKGLIRFFDYIESSIIMDKTCLTIH